MVTFTTQDILNLTLAGGFILIVIFLSTVLLYLAMILRDINKITSYTRKTAKKLNETIIEPVKFVRTFWKNLIPVLDVMEDKIKERIKNYKKNKKREA